MGDITYECRDKANAPGVTEWVFVGPNAVLNDRSGKQVGKYYGPPATWESMDGSKLTATQLAAALAGMGNIPCWWESFKVWRGLAGTGFAAAAVMAAVLVSQQGVLPTGSSPQFMMVLVAPQQTAPGWVVQANNPRELSLIPLGQDVVPAEK